MKIKTFKFKEKDSQKMLLRVYKSQQFIGIFSTFYGLWQTIQIIYLCPECWHTYIPMMFMTLYCIMFTRNIYTYEKKYWPMLFESIDDLEQIKNSILYNEMSRAPAGSWNIGQTIVVKSDFMDVPKGSKGIIINYLPNMQMVGDTMQFTNEPSPELGQAYLIHLKSDPIHKLTMITQNSIEKG